jgi:hypothetical protein
MTTTKETEKAIQEAAERLEQARMDAQRISDLINAQPAAFDARRLAKAREKAEDLSAAVMLGEASREALDDARADVASLEFEESTAAFEARQFAEGRAGLERRLAEAQAVIKNAETDLIKATNEWLICELFAAEQEYTIAAQKAVEAFARIKSIDIFLQYGGANSTVATRTHLDILLPVMGPASIAATDGKLRGGIRGLIGPTASHMDVARTELKEEVKKLGALWITRQG